MRKIRLFMAFVAILFTTTIVAQENEPSFIGEVNLVKADGTVLQLDKNAAQVKTKAGASVYLTGIGKIKSKINVDGAHAVTRVGKDEEFKLIVKSVDNASDPLSIINIFSFDVSKKARKAELSSLGTFGGHSDNNLELIPYSAKKYGEASYEIILKTKPVGEIGITVKNPNHQDEKSLIVACLGIDE
ncbi:hypothetical protein [Phocaeicola sp.]